MNIRSCQTSASLFHAVRARFVPTRGTLAAIFPGQSFPVRAAEALAVIPRRVKPGRAVLAAFLDDHLVFCGFEGFAVVAGFVGAGGAGVALAGDGGLGCCARS